MFSDDDDLPFLNDDGKSICLVADHPIRVRDSEFYYEVKLLKKAEEKDDSEDEKRDTNKDKDECMCVAVGLATRPVKTILWFPGFPQSGGQSYGYHCDNVKLISTTMLLQGSLTFPNTLLARP